MKAILYLFLVMSLAACAATGAKFQGLRATDKTSAIIYVYRPHNFANRNAYPHLFIDGVKRGSLRDSGYTANIVEPGLRKLELQGDFFTWSVKPLIIEQAFEGNKRYFFRFTSQTSTSVTGITTITTTGLYKIQQVSEQEALMELPDLNLSQ